MRTGRPPKTAKALELAGTTRHDRPRKEQEHFAPLQLVPAPPDWLEIDAVAVDEWKRLAPLLIADGSLAEKDLQTLANLCLVQSKIMRNFRGELVDIRGCHSTYARYASALGLAVGWRARVVKGEKEQAKNPFEALKQRPN